MILKKSESLWPRAETKDQILKRRKEIDIDEDLKLVKEAAGLIKESKKQLKEAENTFEEIEKEIEIDSKIQLERSVYTFSKKEIDPKEIPF